MSNLAIRKKNNIQTSDHLKLKPFPASIFIDKLIKDIKNNFHPREEVDLLFVQEFLYNAHKFSVNELEFGPWRYNVQSIINHFDATVQITIVAENISGIGLILIDERVFIDDVCLKPEPQRELINRFSEIFEEATEKSNVWNSMDVAPYIGPKPQAKKFFYDFKKSFDYLLESEYNEEFGYWGAEDYKQNTGASLFSVMEIYETAEETFGEWTVWQDFMPAEEEIVWATQISRGGAPSFLIDTEIKYMGHYSYDEILYVVERKNKELLRVTSNWNNFVGGDISG